MTANDSINTTTEWLAEEGVVMPVEVRREETTAVPKASVAPRPVQRTQTAIKVSKGVPKYLSWPYEGGTTGNELTDTAPTDSVPTDTVAADSVATDSVVPGAELKGIMLVNPASEYMRGMEKPETHKPGLWGGMSWVYLALTLMFCMICLKFKGNSRYMKALYADLTNTRLRNNVFDETVRETSLLVLMNIMWVLNAGVILWTAVRQYSGLYVGAEGVMSPNSMSITCPDWIGIGICACVSAVYMLVQTVAYWVIGNVFSDRCKTGLWVKGSAASTALETFLLFPIALLMLIYPEWRDLLLWMGIGVFILGKMVFLYKGFRIFFAEISSWMLFLYYLCSLEIVPLILTYFGAVVASASWH